MALPKEQARRRILALTRNDRISVAFLAYAGLAVRDVSGVRPEHIKATIPHLPGSSNGRGLSWSEARRLFRLVEREASQRDECMVKLSMLCGLRQVELRRMTSDSVSYDHDGRVYVHVEGKGGKRRSVYVPAQVAPLLLGLVQEDGPVFRSTQGGPLSSRGMRAAINKYLKKVVPDASPHDLRHTLLTWLLNTGATLEEAMEIAGHDTASSHEIYAAASDGWFVSAWEKYHPLADWFLGGVGHVNVPGFPYERRMSRGVERVVPIPLDLVDLLRVGVENERTSTQISDMFRGVDTNPSELRESASVSMAESGAHPFLVGLVMGVTPGHVVRSKLDRRGEVAEAGRIEAMERVATRVEEDEYILRVA